MFAQLFQYIYLDRTKIPWCCIYSRGCRVEPIAEQSQLWVEPPKCGEAGRSHLFDFGRLGYTDPILGGLLYSEKKDSSSSRAVTLITLTQQVIPHGRLLHLASSLIGSPLNSWRAMATCTTDCVLHQRMIPTRRSFTDNPGPARLALRLELSTRSRTRLLVHRRAAYL